MTRKSNTISRRVALTLVGGTAVNAAVIANTKATDTPPASDGDAELIRLGRQLDPIEAEVKAQQALDRVRADAFNTKLYAATGIPRDQAPEVTCGFGEDDGTPNAAYYLTMHRISKEMDADKSEPWDDIHDRMWPLLREILTHKPTTLLGLAIVTRAAILAFWNEWEEENEDERNFMRAVCSYCEAALPVN